MLRSAVANLFTRKRLRVFVARLSADDLGLLAEMSEAGTLRPVIEKTFPLDETADAFRHLETWRTRGKIAITI
jgi:NADPH:quinone reductase-like Zn-dependent oxidoreductase